ncbi:MAG TPA: hypothetical protein VGK87_06565 [Anaerolineae bacterium]
MLLLLDLDGTLIHDRAYREAIDATIIRYATEQNLTIAPPLDNEIHALHAHGFSNEWDLVAFLAGILQRSHYVGDTSRPDYLEWTYKTAAMSGLPNERARDVLMRESPEELHPLLHSLLDEVTDVEHTATTRLFAEYVLGSELFSLHYGLVQRLHTPSLLEALDEPLIDETARQFILRHHSCVFTARPSLPPDHHMGHPTPPEASSPVHPPEAEIGLRLLNLERLPMIALGHVQWVADQFDERVYDLTKPSPVQALAAFLAAAGEGEKEALLAAYRIWKRGESSEVFRRIMDEHIYVLEDNAAGIRACLFAAELLSSHGINVTIHGLGVTNAAPKRMALLPVCDAVFENPNDALASIPG